MNSIFVSIVSYRDILLKQTVESLLDNASKPDNITIGVFEQSNEKTDLEKFKNVVYMHVPAHASKGCAWARSHCQEMYEYQDFYFQIDSHTLVDKAWDYYFVQNYYDIYNSKVGKNNTRDIILSTYPAPFYMENGIAALSKDEGKTRQIKIINGRAFVDGYYCRQISHTSDTFDPIRGFFVSGGCIFGSNKFVEEVPYDRRFYFEEDELSIALKCFTRGIDIYHTSKLPVWHLYTTPETKYRQLHWDDHANAGRLRDSSHERLKQVINGDPDIEKQYQLGKHRSLAQFEQLTGLDVKRAKVTDSSKCMEFELKDNLEIQNRHPII